MEAHPEEPDHKDQEKPHRARDPEQEARTVFVGNLSTEVNIKVIVIDTSVLSCIRVCILTVFFGVCFTFPSIYLM